VHLTSTQHSSVCSLELCVIHLPEEKTHYTSLGRLIDLIDFNDFVRLSA